MANGISSGSSRTCWIFPHHAQEADIEIPLWEWGLPDNAMLDVDDLLTERRFAWSGKIQHVRLDPDEMPFAIWRVQPHRG